MPAETHQHSDPLSTREVMALLSAVVVGDIVSSTSLAELGLDDDVVLLAFWDAAVEEFAERTLGQPDLSELYEARTVGELVAATVQCLRQPEPERR